MRGDDFLTVEHVRCYEWLNRYRDRLIRTWSTLTAEQLDELVTPQVYVDLAGEHSPEAAADLETDHFMPDHPRG